MNFIKSLALFTCVMLSFANTSFAEQKYLEKSQVAAFIGSQRVLHGLSEQLKTAGHQSFFKYNPKLMDNKNIPMFIENIKILKEDTPDFYNRFTTIVTGYTHDSDAYRFSSAEDWARVGDRVMLAYYGEHSTASLTVHDDAMAIFTPDILARLKPEARAKVQEQLSMLSSIQNVPLADKKLVDSFDKQIVAILFEMY